MTGDDWRVALDVAPVRAQPAGVGRYAASLAAALGRLLPADRLVLVGLRPEAGSVVPGAHGVALRSGHYHAWMQLRADRDARRAGAALVHYTNAAAPLIARLPYVVTAHDLSLLRMPRTHPPPRLASVPVMLAAVRRARAIIVHSRWTGRELVRLLRVTPARVHVIEHAPTDDRRPGEQAVRETAARFGVTRGRYVMALGTLEPRKNLVRLVGAWEQLAEHDPSLRIVIAGAPGWRRQAIESRIAGSPFRDRIVVTGYLSDGDVAALIAGSGVVAYVSLYEGYGMPVIEAMALGAAVVTSNRTAMPEAAGGAGVLVDPYDVEDIARGLREAIARRDELAVAGRSRVAGRTWDDVAREHLEVYRSVLAARSR